MGEEIKVTADDFREDYERHLGPCEIEDSAGRLVVRDDMAAMALRRSCSEAVAVAQQAEGKSLRRSLTAKG